MGNSIKDRKDKNLSNNLRRFPVLFCNFQRKPEFSENCLGQATKSQKLKEFISGDTTFWLCENCYDTAIHTGNTGNSSNKTSMTEYLEMLRIRGDELNKKMAIDTKPVKTDKQDISKKLNTRFIPDQNNINELNKIEKEIEGMILIKWTKEQEQFLLDNATNHTVYELREMMIKDFGITRQTDAIREKAKSLGVPPKYKEWTRKSLMPVEKTTQEISTSIAYDNAFHSEVCVPIKNKPGERLLKPENLVKPITEDKELDVRDEILKRVAIRNEGANIPPKETEKESITFKISPDCEKRDYYIQASHTGKDLLIIQNLKDSLSELGTKTMIASYSIEFYHTINHALKLVKGDINDSDLVLSKHYMGGF